MAFRGERTASVRLVMCSEPDPALPQERLTEDFDACAMSWRVRDTTIGGDQRSAKRLGQRHVARVVGAQVVAQFPHSYRQDVVGISNEREIEKVIQRLSATLDGDSVGGD